MEIRRRYRVDGKAAVVVGARVLVADRHLASARETADMIVAEGALYLHSDEAGFVTGVSLAVDGGEGVSWGS